MTNITFRQFIQTYNFRYINGEIGKKDSEDTQIIRIYPATEEYDNDLWFEFGVYDFENDRKEEIVERVFSTDILDSFVESFGYNDSYQRVFTVFLTKKFRGK